MAETGKNMLNEFQTATSGGAPAKYRFSSPKAIRNIYDLLKRQDITEADRRTRLRRAYDGHLPYDPAKIQAMGLKNISNVTALGLKGQIDARVALVQDMALDTTGLVELRPTARELAGPEAERIGEVVAQEFSQTLRDSPRFLDAFTGMTRDCELYGLGPLTWPDYKDFEPISLERGQLKFLETASPVCEDNDLYMIESTIRADYLFGLLDDPDAAKAEGWNVEAVRQFIITVFVKGTNTASDGADPSGTSVQESQLTLWRQNRMYETNQFQVAQVLHVYAKEMTHPRKITHYIVTPAGDDGDNFLLRRPDAYETMAQCLQWMPYTKGERYARALRGLATYLLPMEDVSNRLLCKTIDAGFRAASFMLQSQTAAGSQRLTIVEQGPYISLPQGTIPSQSQVAPNFPQITALRETILNTAFNNAMGTRGAAAVSERVYSGADRKTKDQIQNESSAGARVEKSRFILQASTFDRVFRETFRRFMKLVADPGEHENYPAVADFIERCERRRVALKDLKRVADSFTIYTCRDLVNGGADVKAVNLEAIVGSVGGNLDEPGRIAATRDMITCRLGIAAADRYRPTAGRDQMPSDSASHATLENNDIRELAKVLTASDQLHWSHIPMHWLVIKELAEQAQAGQIQEPQRALDIMANAADHIREHLSFGRGQTGMEPRAKQIESDLRSLTPIIKMLTMQAAAIEKARIAEQRQQETEQEALRKKAEGKEMEVKMHEIDTKAALKLREQDLDQGVKMAGVQNKAQIDTASAQAKAQANMAAVRDKGLTDRLAAIQAQEARLVQSGSITGNRPPNAGGMGGRPQVPPPVEQV